MACVYAAMASLKASLNMCSLPLSGCEGRGGMVNWGQYAN